MTALLTRLKDPKCEGKTKDSRKRFCSSRCDFSIRNVHDQTTGHGTKVSRSDQGGKQVAMFNLKSDLCC